MDSQGQQPVASTSQATLPAAAQVQEVPTVANGVLPAPAALPDEAAQAAILASTNAFEAAQLRAQATPNAPAYTQPPPYTALPKPADVPAPTGIVRKNDSRFVTREEDERMAHDVQRDLKTAAENYVVVPVDPLSLTVADLRRQGYGRVSSGFCYSTRMMLHKTLDTIENQSDDPHPEQPARISTIFNYMQRAGLIPRMKRITIREAVKEEVTLVHSEAHWERVWGTSFQTVEYLQRCAEFFDRLSLYVNPESAFCARLSCGGVIEMCRAVAEGQIRNGFAIVRPPGHHAEPEEPGGFCFFNNAAVAAKWLLSCYDGKADTSDQPRAIKKVLILDWDVHHGNGTQKAFWGSSEVLYISLHRHDGSFYPGGTYGGADMVGQEQGAGFSVNVPFPEKGMTDSDYLYAFQQVVMPIAYEFDPDFVIVSAGYDAAEGDQLGLMKVTPAGFAHMTHMLSVLADGKLVLALEGGYNVDAIANCAVACTQVLLGDEPPRLQLRAATVSATETVHEVARVQSKYWKSMGVALESFEELQTAGKVVPVSDILKAHRTYDLYHEYGLYNLKFADDLLEEFYHDQMLCSDNVYQCETLLLFMHDLGSLKAHFSAATLDLQTEMTVLLDTSRHILDWALKENKFGVIDVNFLSHLPTQPGIPPDAVRERSRERKLALYIWENIISISDARNIVFVGSGCGCSALMQIVQSHPDVRERVRACVSVLGLEDPPQLDPTTGMRNWYKDHSLVLVPATHSLHEDARRTGKHQKKYGNIYRPAEGTKLEGRPIHLLEASLPQIKSFVADKLARRQGGSTSHSLGQLLTQGAPRKVGQTSGLGTAALLGGSVSVSAAASATSSGTSTPAAAPPTAVSMTTIENGTEKKDADGDVAIRDATAPAPSQAQ